MNRRTHLTSREAGLLGLLLVLILVFSSSRAHSTEIPNVPVAIEALSRTYCEGRVDASIEASTHGSKFLFNTFVGERVRTEHISTCMERELWHLRHAYWIAHDLLEAKCLMAVATGKTIYNSAECVIRNEPIVWDKVLDAHRAVVVQ